jgi:hypothetical protein
VNLKRCPHGDVYAALAGSGTLDTLLAAGVKYMFVSDSDNVGATLDLDLLTYFAQQDLSFLMECCERRTVVRLTSAQEKDTHCKRCFFGVIRLLVCPTYL